MFRNRGAAMAIVLSLIMAAAYGRFTAILRVAGYLLIREIPSNEVRKLDWLDQLDDQQVTIFILRFVKIQSL